MIASPVFTSKTRTMSICAGISARRRIRKELPPPPTGGFGKWVLRMADGGARQGRHWRGELRGKHLPREVVHRQCPVEDLRIGREIRHGQHSMGVRDQPVEK